MDALWRLIRSIPQGHVASYGTVGAHLDPPTSGRAVGRWLANSPDDVPWWRVVGKGGGFPVEKKGLGLASLQEQHLNGEGVETIEGRVDMARYAIWDLPF